jgi:hypothetical protein
MTSSRNRRTRRSPSSDSSSSSSSDSSSSSQCYTKKNKKEKHKHKHKHHESESCESKHSEIECFSNEKECKNKDNKHSSSSSSSESEHKFDINQIYQYFKNKLVQDNELMVAGSSAYFYSGNKQNQLIAPNSTAQFANNYQSFNIEKTHPNSPFYVREDGIYIIFFCISTNSSAQFTLFVNGVVQPLTCVGTNSGAGQLVSRQLLALKKDDNVIIRNYISATTVNSECKAGGLIEGNDLVTVFVKLAPLITPKEHHDEVKCLSHKKQRLFKKLTKKLLVDSELMVKGFNTTGSFFNTVQQTVNTETDVVFGAFQNVNGLQWNPTGSNPEQIKVLEDGMYKVFFLCNTHNPAQFTYCINGLPDENTTTGSNKGAGQISLRALLSLKKNDIITVRNHTSANGNIIINAGSGGFQSSVNVLCTIFKIANLTRPEIKTIDCKIEKKFHCYYEQFRNYLLCKKWLQINGSDAYLSMSGASPQEVLINDALSYSTNTEIKNIIHQQGKSHLLIEKSGIYDLFVDTITDEPDQWTLFINGVPDLSTVFGRESGASRTLLRQIIKLNKGDIVDVRNYLSHAGTITTSVNPGGSYIGNNKQFLLFLLTPYCDDYIKKECPKDNKCKN